MERKNSRQRRDIDSTLGFNRYGLISADDSPYEPPEGYPQDARRYLEGLSRCGTLSGAVRLAGIGVSRVYKFRKKLEGFTDEEEIAQDCLTDVLEESLYACGLGAVSGVARVKALSKALEANRPSKYDRAKRHEVDADVNVSWLDLLEQQEEEEE